MGFKESLSTRDGHVVSHANGKRHTNASAKIPQTDLTRWRLKNVRGRQTWHYLQSAAEIKQWPQTVADKYFLGLDTVRYHFCHADLLMLISFEGITRPSKSEDAH